MSIKDFCRQCGRAEIIGASVALLVALVYKLRSNGAGIPTALLLAIATIVCALFASRLVVVLGERMIAYGGQSRYFYLPCVVAAGAVLANVVAFFLGRLALFVAGYESSVIVRQDAEWNFVFALDEAMGVVRWWFASFFFYAVYARAKVRAQSATRVLALLFTTLSAIGFLLAATLNRA